jgi:hypothetical protein
MADKNENNMEDQKQLLTSMGSCRVTKTITVEGSRIGYMYREEPDDNLDSGWRFLSGTENQKYVDNPQNSEIMDVNEVANLDQTIIPYLQLPFNTELERMEGSDEFHIIE